MTTRNVSAIALVLTMVPVLAHATLEEAVAKTTPREFKSADGGVFRYRWAERQAPDGTKRPAVFLFHGAGECGTNNVSQLLHGATELLAWLDAHEKGYVFVAGQVQSGHRWVERDWSATSGTMPEKPSVPMGQFIALAESLFASDKTIDRNRVYATGISMGGYGTWDVICRRPEWFAAALPICGGADVAQAVRIRDIPVWTFHGSADTAVPVCRSRQMMSALWAIGANAHYREYPDADHGVWERTYGDKEVLAWFFRQRKADKPTDIPNRQEGTKK